MKYLESQAKTSGRTVCYWWAVNVKVISELHRLHCFFCQSRPCLSVLLVKCYYNTVYKCETFVSNLSRQTLIVWESHSNPFDYVTLTHFATHFHNFVTFIITYLQWLFRGFRLPWYFPWKVYVFFCRTLLLIIWMIFPAEQFYYGLTNCNHSVIVNHHSLEVPYQYYFCCCIYQKIFI